MEKPLPSLIKNNFPSILLHQTLFIINFLNLPQGEILRRAENLLSHENDRPAACVG